MNIRKTIILVYIFLAFTNVFAQQEDLPFANDIKAFLDNDKISPPPQHAILFAGSSSFTLWKDVQDYFPGYRIINRGFGGSTLTDQLRYARQIILPCNPRQVVIYCGENDFASDSTLSPGAVAERFKQLFTFLRTNLPGVKITYISMKPSPSRWHLAKKFKAANKDISRFLKRQHDAGFVNIWDKMLNSKRLPDEALFLEDKLHMNANGYSIWQEAIQPELIR